MAAEANVTPVADAEPTIRRATADDGDAIGRVQVETWRAAYRGLLPDDVLDGFDVAVRQRLWRDGLSRPRRPGSETIVAEIDGTVVGFTSVGAWRVGEEPEDGV